MIVDLDNPDIVYCGEDGEYYHYNIPIDNFEGYNITEQNKIKTVLIPCKNFSGTKCKNCGARHTNGAYKTHRYCYKCGAEFISVFPAPSQPSQTYQTFEIILTKR